MKDVETRVRKHHIMTPELQKEMEETLNSTYARKYEMMYHTATEAISNSWREDHDCVPDLINNQHLLKVKICDLASTFALEGDIELDQGYSFAYQVTVKFPSYFQ